MAGRFTVSQATAEAIYRVLVDVCAAPDEGYIGTAFVRYMTGDGPSLPKEWRFRGSLGFGGKLLLNGNRDGFPHVTCYPEDETPDRAAIMERANKALREICAEGENA